MELFQKILPYISLGLAIFLLIIVYSDNKNSFKKSSKK